MWLQTHLFQTQHKPHLDFPAVPRASKSFGMWSCLSALCWGHTSHRPHGWFCNASRQLYYTQGVSRWILLTEPGVEKKSSKLATFKNSSSEIIYGDEQLLRVHSILLASYQLITNHTSSSGRTYLKHAIYYICGTNSTVAGFDVSVTLPTSQPGNISQDRIDTSYKVHTQPGVSCSRSWPSVRA